MKTALLAAATAALFLAVPGARAHASATATIGDVTVSQVGSGANFGLVNWYVSLDTGESASETFSYAVTMHTDGLPATRTWDYSSPFACLPLHEVNCGPAPTGHELAEVYIKTYRDDRVANPFILFSGLLSEDVLDTSPGTESFAGTITLTATNLGEGVKSDGIVVFAAMWVDSSDRAPIPEPGSLPLMIAGSAILLRRRLALALTEAGRRRMFRHPGRHGPILAEAS